MGSMFDVCSFEAKNWLFQFEYQKDEHVRVHSMFEKCGWIWSIFDKIFDQSLMIEFIFIYVQWSNIKKTLSW